MAAATAPSPRTSTRSPTSRAAATAGGSGAQPSRYRRVTSAAAAAVPGSSTAGGLPWGSTSECGSNQAANGPPPRTTGWPSTSPTATQCTAAESRSATPLVESRSSLVVAAGDCSPPARKASKSPPGGATAAGSPDGCRTPSAPAVDSPPVGSINRLTEPSRGAARRRISAASAGVRAERATAATATAVGVAARKFPAADRPLPSIHATNPEVFQPITAAGRPGRPTRVVLPASVSLVSATGEACRPQTTATPLSPAVQETAVSHAPSTAVGSATAARTAAAETPAPAAMPSSSSPIARGKTGSRPEATVGTRRAQRRIDSACCRPCSSPKQKLAERYTSGLTGSAAAAAGGKRFSSRAGPATFGSM